jgi:stage IV sporulation protein FB
VGLLEPQPTQFDLKWRMFGIRVRVHPVFWLMACLLGAPYLQPPYGAPYLLVWVACVFVSILVHELGHVVVGRVFGSRGDIVLYAFGGLAVGSNMLPRRWQRVAVLLAGPFAGFLLLGVVYAVRPLIFPRDYYWPQELTQAEKFLLEAFGMLIWMNLVWGILNLLPIYPLDGGQISRELFEAVNPRNGFRIALGISMALAILLAVLFLLAENQTVSIPFLRGGGMYSVVLFGLMAFENYMTLQQLKAPQRQPADDEDDWYWRR